MNLHEANINLYTKTSRDIKKHQRNIKKTSIQNIKNTMKNIKQQLTNARARPPAAPCLLLLLKMSRFRFPEVAVLPPPLRSCVF